MSFNIFDENYYLNSNPDVKAAVQSGAIASGLEHFQKYGLAEGRTSVSPYYDEGLYLRKNPDVAAAVNSGGLKTGLQHYIQYGEAEGRSPGSFDEQFYRQSNPDVVAAIQAGTFSSGLQHYIKYGQFENRFALFSGSTGNDTIPGFGTLDALIGISLGNSLNAQSNQQTPFQGRDVGTGQVDTLIGGSGQDIFYLGDAIPVNNSSTLTPEPFYVGGGNSDYAVIKNFEPGKDVIVLAGSSLSDYTFTPVNGNLNISFKSDLIGVVEGVTALSAFPNDPSDPILLIG